MAEFRILKSKYHVPFLVCCSSQKFPKPEHDFSAIVTKSFSRTVTLISNMQLRSQSPVPFDS